MNWNIAFRAERVETVLNAWTTNDFGLVMSLGWCGTRTLIKLTGQKLLFYRGIVMYVLNHRWVTHHHIYLTSSNLSG